MASDEHWSQAAEGFKILGKFASGNGFAFAFETHMGYLHDTPQAAKKLTDMIGCPAVGVNLDYGNAVYFKKENILPLADTIRHLGKSLLYTHLKNSVNVPGVDKRMPTALSQGEINHREYIKVLKETGYKGPLCVEAPRPGDREWFAAEDLHYIKSVISEVTLAG
jgi:sugar phosphate isomerase/epimerase